MRNRGGLKPRNSLLERSNAAMGIDDFLNTFFFNEMGEDNAKLFNSSWKIYYDDDNEEYVGLFEVPGLNKDEIDVKTDSQKLTIKGKIEDEERKKKFGEREIDFEKRFGETIDDSSMKAQMENGILELRFKFKGDKGMKKIDIS